MEVHMLKSIGLRNFKSYREATLPLAPLTFLIGPNASGKSNALEAIRLLNWLAKGSRIDDIERAIQGGDTMVRGLAKDLFREPEVPFVLEAHLGSAPEGWSDFSIEFSYLNDQLVISAESITKPGEKVALYQIDSAPNAHTDEISVAYNNFAKGRNKPHIPCSNRLGIFYQLETPGRFEKIHQKSQTTIPAVTKALRQALRDVVFLDPRPSLMREYVYAGDTTMKEDGRNLSAVLHGICATPQSKDKLLEFIRSLPEQDITNIEFIETERRDVMVRLEETFGDQTRTVDAPLLSDGTLRVLAIAATLLTAPEGALVVIEEIDNGVHPSRAHMLVTQIQDIASSRKLRVLLTSHNPALVDALPDESLPDVVCCYRNPADGTSRLVRLGDMDRYSEIVAQGPLGQLMTRRVLERFLKDVSTPAERKKAAKDWLASLRQSSGEATE
ncbi:AAA family ATPase [Cupriavidus necator]|uniref:AAA family ATPase n=1 Tax=Cupriavidus necator TaxID=106590 RepID=UPI003ED07D77